MSLKFNLLDFPPNRKICSQSWKARTKHFSIERLKKSQKAFSLCQIIYIYVSIQDLRDLFNVYVHQ